MGNKVSNDVIQEINDKLAKNKSLAHQTHINREKDKVTFDSIRKTKNPIEYDSPVDRGDREREAPYYTQVYLTFTPLVIYGRK